MAAHWEAQIHRKKQITSFIKQNIYFKQSHQVKPADRNICTFSGQLAPSLQVPFNVYPPVASMTTVLLLIQSTGHWAHYPTIKVVRTCNFSIIGTESLPQSHAASLQVRCGWQIKVPGFKSPNLLIPSTESLSQNHAASLQVRCGWQIKAQGFKSPNLLIPSTESLPQSLPTGEVWVADQSARVQIPQPLNP